MWSIFAEEIEDYDQNVTNAQNNNITSVLVFVGHDLLIVASLVMIGLKDWPLLCNRVRFCYSELSIIVPRLWRQDHVSSRANLTAAGWV